MEITVYPVAEGYKVATQISIGAQSIFDYISCVGRNVLSGNLILFDFFRLTLKPSILALLLLGFTSETFCQEFFTIRGTIVDASMQEPLVFANILDTESRAGCVTDSKGAFSMELPRSPTILLCSFVGYRAVEVSLSGNRDTTLVIMLDAIDILLQDVTVYAYRPTGTKRVTESIISLRSNEIKSSTSIIPDVLRSVQLLPGVSVNNEFNAKFNVRGGNQDENLMLINGTQVYDPYHVKEVPNASIGIMQMDLIKKMDLMTGGFPARYGDKMSSVVDIEYREGNRERFEGIANVSLTDANVIAEGPLSEKGSFILGLRKSYFEYLLKFLNRGTYHHPSFYDAQGVVDYSPGSGQKLFFKFLHAGDSYTQDPLVQHSLDEGSSSIRESGDSLNNQGQYYSTLLSGQYTNIVSPSAIIKTELAFYDERDSERFWDDSYSRFHDATSTPSVFDSSYSLQLYRNNLRVRTLDLNSSLDWQLSPSYTINTGFRYQHITFNQNQSFQYTFDQITNTVHYPDTSITHDLENILDVGFNNLLNAQSWNLAGYVENHVQLSDHFLLNIGGRIDYFDLDKAFSLSPRIQVACLATEALTVRGAWGVFFQSPNYRQIAYSTPSDTNTQPQKAIHYVLGANYHLNLGDDEQRFLNLKVEGFYKDYITLMSAHLTSSGIVYYSRKNDAVGTAKGLDAYIIYSGPRLYGALSYSYLVSMQDVLNDAQGFFPRNTDQRHTLAFAGTWKIGSRWNLSVRFVYGSGYPYTPLSARYDSTGKNWEWVEAPPNSGRLPAYRRTDLRISKDLLIFDLMTSLFLDVSNVFNANNIQSFRFSRGDNGQPLKEEVKLWPVLPSVGISVQW